MRRTIDPQRPPTSMVRAAYVPAAIDSADHLAMMERRLADGYARIEDARAQGQDVTAWEAFWIDLLHEYEMAVDDLQEAA